MILKTRNGIKFRVSDDVNPEFFKRPWYASKHGSNYYIRRVIRYRDNNIPKRRTEYLHRLITNCPSGMTVEHIDGNTLNNENENLKIVSVEENTKLMWARVRI
jgi:hypothetical protein